MVVQTGTNDAESDGVQKMLIS